MKKLNAVTMLVAFMFVVFLGGLAQADDLCRECIHAKNVLNKYVDEAHEALQKKESGDVIGYKWSHQGCEKMKLNFYVGYNFGSDGCLGVSQDKSEASQYLQKVKQVVNGRLATRYGVNVIACGLGQPNPGDAKYFTNCQLGGFIPHDYWVIKCMVEKPCARRRTGPRR